MPVNELGQPIGEAVTWSPGPALEAATLVGRTCRLEPLTEDHVDGLFAALCVESPASIWTYMNAGPFADREGLAGHLQRLAALPATVPLTVLTPEGAPVGIATWLRIDHAMGTAEVGHITYAAALQQTTAATEAMFLMAAHAFEVVGLRRYEWKCDALNAPSRRAAERFGFTFEGVFRKAIHYKGRNRDTAWFAMVDDDWPRIKAGYDAWLDPANFDEQGRQLSALHSGSRPARASSRSHRVASSGAGTSGP